jgi:hypothetical protein
LAKDIYYLKHDTNAHRDPKMMRLRAKYGNEGYGAFWVLAEMMREQEGGRCLRSDAEVLALEIRFDCLSELIDDCCAWGIFECSEEEYWAPRMVRDMEAYQKRKDSARIAGAIGASKRWHSNERKGEEKKGKKSKSPPTPKKKQYAESVALTDEEHAKLVDNYGKAATAKAIAKLNNYKGESGKRYKSDYRALLNWAFEAVGAHPLKKPEDQRTCKHCGAARPPGNKSFCSECGEDY